VIIKGEEKVRDIVSSSDIGMSSCQWVGTTAHVPNN